MMKRLKLKKAIESISLRHLQPVLIISILVVAGLVRFVNLEINPTWYSDEGTLVNIAHNLRNGTWRYMALDGSTLLSARMPLFPIILSFLFRFFEPDIATLRHFTALLGLLSVFLTYLCLSAMLGNRNRILPLMSAAILAIFPDAIIYSRVGFSYNLLPPLLLIAILGCWKFLENGDVRWLYIAGISVGVAITSDLIMINFLPPLLLIGGYRKPKFALQVSGIALVPVALYGIAMLLLSPGDFFFDMGFMFGRVSNIPFIGQIPMIMANLGGLMLSGIWTALGILGLLVVQPRRLFWILALFFWIPFAGITRIVAAISLGYYYMIPLVPLMAIGIASLLCFGIPRLSRVLADGIVLAARRIAFYIGRNLDVSGRLVNLVSTTSVIVGLLLSPILYSMYATKNALTTGFKSSMTDVSINPADARRVAAHINSVAGDTEVVIGSPAFIWMVEDNGAGFQQSLASMGEDTMHYPASMPSNRFAFDPNWRKAEYIVIDPVILNWGARMMPAATEMVTEVRSWPIEISYGEMTVFRNPNN
jgi:hypothetical protein